MTDEPRANKEDEEDEDAGAAVADGEPEDAAPRITLDRYLSRRRSPRSGIPQLVAAAVMLVTLVLLVLYKDRCGAAVSGLMGEIAPPAEKAGTPARYEPGPRPGSE